MTASSNANANNKEKKRKKRLTRNRASARLRKLKKKNLVGHFFIYFKYAFGVCIFVVVDYFKHIILSINMSSLSQIDSYEGEVGILKPALSKLRSHKWTADNHNREALIKALSMECGQQPLTAKS